MKKSVSSPTFLHAEATKRSSTIRRNAFSWNQLSDALPSYESEQTELVEKIDAIVPASLSQKMYCYEAYGFPSDILASKALPKEKTETLLDLASCLVTPEEPPSNTNSLQFRETQSTRVGIEERFQRMLVNIRRRRKSLSMSL